MATIYRRGTAAEVKRRKHKPPARHDLPCGRFPAPERHTATWLGAPEVKEYDNAHLPVENDGTLVAVRLTAHTAPSGGDFVVQVRRWRPSTDTMHTLHTITLADGDKTNIDKGNFGDVDAGDHLRLNVTAANGADKATLQVTLR